MAETYTTRSGDVWDAIAYRTMGSCNHVEALINANRQYIKTSVFSAGTVLALPEKTSKNTVKLPPWRR